MKKSLEDKQKRKKKREKEQIEDFEDDLFYFVAGYTENGIPFGITRAEMEEKDENLLKSPKNEHSLKNRLN